MMLYLRHCLIFAQICYRPIIDSFIRAFIINLFKPCTRKCPSDEIEKWSYKKITNNKNRFEYCQYNCNWRWSAAVNIKIYYYSATIITISISDNNFTIQCCWDELPPTQLRSIECFYNCLPRNHFVTSLLPFSLYISLSLSRFHSRVPSHIWHWVCA